MDAATVMYLNEHYWYKHGYQVTLKADGKKLAASQVEIDQSDAQYYRFKVTDESLDGQEISVHVLPL